eukprot:Gb_13653 [translate_table: standard]
MSAVCEHPAGSAFMRPRSSGTCKQNVTPKKSVGTSPSESNSNRNDSPLVKIEGKSKFESRGSQKSLNNAKASRNGTRNGVRSGESTPEKDPSTPRDFHVMRHGITRYTRKHEAPKPSKVAPEGMAIPVEVEVKQRCGWMTSQTSSDCIAYHDEEWGVAVHDDRKLFELLVLAGAQAELTRPTILNKRDAFREPSRAKLPRSLSPWFTKSDLSDHGIKTHLIRSVQEKGSYELPRIAFADFDIATVAAFDEEKIMSLASSNETLQHEGKIRGVVDNAKCILEIVKHFGSFDKYIWGFVNHKPIASNYRFSRQIPVKTPKSEYISKDFMKRGFRFVGPTIMYSFMQAAGMTNNHLVHCFRHKECIVLAERHSLGDIN